MRNRLIVAGILTVLFAAGYYFGSNAINKNVVTKRTQIILGTTVEILIRGEKEDKGNPLFEKGFAEFHRIDSLFSTYIEGNPIHRFNNSESDTVTLNKEIVEVLKASDEMNRNCEEGFDVTLGKLTDLWGFSGQNPAKPGDEKIKEIMNESGWKNIKILNDSTVIKKNKVNLNLSAIAKGYAVDKAFELMKKSGGKDFLVNAGGEIRADGTDWKIGIQNPDNENDILMNLKPQEGKTEICVATSGDYENFFMEGEIRYHHILNPKTGYPSRECRSVTIIAKDVTTADALATGIFVAGGEKGIKIIEQLENTECYIISKDGKIYESQGFKNYVRNR
mgnify:FL=1